MSEITTMILEKVLTELIEDYNQKMREVGFAQHLADISEMYLREFIPVIVRESGGIYNAKKILASCELDETSNESDSLP